MSSSTPPAATASAPGKLILSGEHAVVYGRPALVAAVDLRLTARLAIPTGADSRPHSEAPVRVSVPALDLETETRWSEIRRHADEARRRWREWSESDGAPPFAEGQAAMRSEDPSHLLKVALGEVAAALGEDAGPPLAVLVDSQLPTGSGFGSSAAAALALVAAYAALRGADVSAAELEAIALEVERRQHGSPSGVDGATVLHGGFVWAEADGAGRLAISPFEPAAAEGGHPALVGLVVYDTGRPAEGTGTVVAAVREGWRRDRARYEALWDEMEDATRGLGTLLADPSSSRATSAASDAVALHFRRCQRALEGIGVVPEAVRTLVRTVEAAGGAAKISGAGSLSGPGAGTLLVHHPEPEALAELPTLGLLRRLPVRLGGPGLRLETHPLESHSLLEAETS